MPPSLDLPTFIARWQKNTLSERSAAQSHFIDVCAVLGMPTPAAVDPTGSEYTFEKGVTKVGGGGGWADVWKRGYVAWEYKGKHRDLKAAYQQLLQYREDLENPPLLVVCDLDRFEVHTNFTGTVKAVYAFSLADLAKPEPTPTSAKPPLDVLRAVFTHPESLRPTRTTAQVTEPAAAEFARLADSLRTRGEEPERAAHFLMRLLFCLFAEDIGLLPTALFARLVAATRQRPTDFGARIRQLFAAMSTGGSFGVDDIAYFNGGLFADDAVLDLGLDRRDARSLLKNPATSAYGPAGASGGARATRGRWWGQQRTSQLYRRQQAAKRASTRTKQGQRGCWLPPERAPARRPATGGGPSPAN